MWLSVDVLTCVCSCLLVVPTLQSVAGCWLSVLDGSGDDAGQGLRLSRRYLLIRNHHMRGRILLCVWVCVSLCLCMGVCVCVWVCLCMGVSVC